MPNQMDYRETGGAGPAPAPDNVNSPSHYTAGGIECIEAIESALTPEEYRGYIKGNLMKYIWRERIKNGDEDLRKCRWYLDRYLKSCDDEERGK